MSFISKPIITVVLTVVIIVAGFFFLFRGCLSKYDERSAIPHVLYFEKDGKQVVFSIVKYERATSYSRQGNMVRKSVSINYYIQTNDANTAKKIDNKKIKHSKDIKSYPVRILGDAANNAWVFIGEVMAFDPFTLEKKADVAILEENNPQAKGMFPTEGQYYTFNNTDKNIYFTAKDGSPWKIDTKSLKIFPVDEDEHLSSDEKELERIETLMKQNIRELDTLMENKLRNPSKRLQAKEISLTQYQQMINGFNEQRTNLYKVRDSLQQLKNKYEKAKRTGDDVQRKIEALAGSSTGVNFNQVKTNQDTVNGKWFGLYTTQEFEKLYERVQTHVAYDEKARRQLFTSVYNPDKYGEYSIDKAAASKSSSAYFLDGGFLLDRKTSLPVRFADKSYLIVYKNQIGAEGKIQLSRITESGKQLWTFNTGLKTWGSYLLTGKQLILTGNNNKELSSTDCNLLVCIKLDEGTSVSYDFFEDK